MAPNDDAQPSVTRLLTGETYDLPREHSPCHVRFLDGKVYVCAVDESWSAKLDDLFLRKVRIDPDTYELQEHDTDGDRFVSFDLAQLSQEEWYIPFTHDGKSHRLRVSRAPWSQPSIWWELRRFFVPFGKKPKEWVRGILANWRVWTQWASPYIPTACAWRKSYDRANNDMHHSRHA